MRLSTIYILKHVLPIELAYKISEYDDYKYIKIVKNPCQLSELDMDIFIYPIYYTIFAFQNFVNCIYQQDIFKKKINRDLISVIRYILEEKNTIIYDILHNIEDIDGFTYYINHVEPMSRTLLIKTINNLNTVISGLIKE